MWNRYCFIFVNFSRLSVKQTQIISYHLLICASRVLLLQKGTNERLPGRQHISSTIYETRTVNLKWTGHSGCLHYASKVSLQPETKPVHLHELRELTLASLLKLLPNNDTQACVRSHAPFFAWICLFPSVKVHSSVSRKYFPIVALVSPSVVQQVGSHHNPRPAAARKKTGVTLREMSMFQRLTLATGMLVQITPAGTDGANC